MQRFPVRSHPGVLILCAVLAGGCTNVDQLADPNPAFETLVVAYGDPGPTTSGCDDYLPILDGVAQNVEWDKAEPLFVRMSPENGNGGAEYFLEVRAIWTDEGRLGIDGSDRIYFLLRYPDNDQDLSPDQLAYITAPDFTQPLCDNLVQDGGKLYCPSPVPGINNVEVEGCDTLLADNKYWTKLNTGGREDQVFLMITRVTSAADVTSLIDLNRDVLGKLGPQLAGPTSLAGAQAPTELWAWRAGRTNLHPVPQFPDWTGINSEQPIPPPIDSRFAAACGFCEDLWVEGGQARADAGINPFVRNFGTTNPENGQIRLSPDGTDTLDTRPIWLTECPPGGRDPSEEELANLNGGLPKDLALWRPDAKFMNVCDSLACSRSGGRPPKWSVRLLPGEFDYLQGWALRMPFQAPSGPTSSRDVRARGVFEAGQDKGFTVWSLEVMRSLNTGQSDDLLIDPPLGSSETWEYRMVIGVLDASGRVGSGSTEIRLKFSTPSPSGTIADRC